MCHSFLLYFHTPSDSIRHVASGTISIDLTNGWASVPARISSVEAVVRNDGPGTAYDVTLVAALEAQARGVDIGRGRGASGFAIKA